MHDINRVKFDIDGEVEHDTKELFGTHIAAGVQTGPFRTELELNNSKDIKFGDTDEDGTAHVRIYKYSVMANAYYDYNTCTPWTPYVGAGLGMSWLKTKMWDDDEKLIDKSVYNLAWQVMAGIAYKVNSNWTLDAGYRYADLGRIRKNLGYDTVIKTAVRDHEIMLGARYNF